MKGTGLQSVPHLSLECGACQVPLPPPPLFAFRLLKALRDQDPSLAVPKHLAWRVGVFDVSGEFVYSSVANSCSVRFHFQTWVGHLTACHRVEGGGDKGTQTQGGREMLDPL